MACSAGLEPATLGLEMRGFVVTNSREVVDISKNPYSFNSYS